MEDESKDTGTDISSKSLPKGLLEAVKANIREMSGNIEAIQTAIISTNNQKEKDALKKSLECATKDIDSLKESDLSIAAHNPKSNIYVVHAGKFGLRKVVLK